MALGKSSASPQTSRSGCVARCIANPSRTTGWSSTIKTFALVETAPAFVFVIAIAPGQGTGHNRSTRGRRGDLQDAADLSSAIVHDSETEPVALVEPGLYSDAVISDLQPQAAWLSKQRQANVSWPSVPHGIADRFLSDPEQLRGRRMIGKLNPLRAFGGNLYAGRLCRPRSQVIEGRR